MTDAVIRRDVDTGNWWDHRPVFSATDKGTRITGLAPGQPLGRVTTRLVVSAVLCFAAWGALTWLGSSLLCLATSTTSSRCAVDVGDEWPTIAGFVVAGYLTLHITVDLSEHARERLGQRRAASLFRSAPLLAGMAVGCGIAAAVAIASDPPEVIRQTIDCMVGTESIAISAVVASCAAGWGLTVVARLPGALRHAHERQSTIERLRLEGRRYAGRLHLGEISFWLGDNPELNVTVTYGSTAGQHEVRARMRTSPDRVPADGSRVLVFTDLNGTIHIELDAAAGTVFEPEQRYTAAE
ncbi:hypothetical protein AB4Z38_03045 [Arthrobacter sp. 2RAF6]|uniref:hypothetical protein n=1 Tax=Arthrobacter sp. 2RAF6 TaxID=3233002 RepID=UPI003F930021